jgi:hypothetical protein
MTNTYSENDPIENKIYEEARCLRCVLERILRVMDEGLFVDYQLEKFSGQERKIKITESVLRFFLKQGKNYNDITEKLKRNKSTISEHVKKRGLDKEFNIKRGAKKGYMPTNLDSLHVKGEKNPMWKGDNVGYQALHTWVRDRLGKAKKCKQCNSTKNVEWANKSHKYKRDKEDWIQLCRKCHIRYDKENSNMDSMKINFDENLRRRTKEE